MSTYTTQNYSEVLEQLLHYASTEENRLLKQPRKKNCTYSVFISVTINIQNVSRTQRWKLFTGRLQTNWQRCNCSLPYTLEGDCKLSVRKTRTIPQSDFPQWEFANKSLSVAPLRSKPCQQRETFFKHQAAGALLASPPALRVRLAGIDLILVKE